jgi:peroxiredoxin
VTRTLLIIFLAVGVALIPVGARAVSIGDKAPLFTAVSNKGEVSLENYQGQKYVIIAFYYAINTSA